jgi:hypothetical protein
MALKVLIMNKLGGYLELWLVVTKIVSKYLCPSNIHFALQSSTHGTDN